MHLTDDQLNEYLDDEIQDPAQVELHLSSCADCAARLARLRVLFSEIETLPELSLSRDISKSIMRQITPPASLPRSLRLTMILQTAAGAVALIFAAPFLMKLFSSNTSSLSIPSFVNVFLRLQTQWKTWPAMLSQLQLPTIPEIPVIEISSLYIMFILVGVSFLWLIGNGLLLRNQLK